jgi:hypothetical protein
MKRPDGVTAIAVYRFLVGTFYLIGACAILAFPIPAILQGGGRAADLYFPLVGVGMALLVVAAFAVANVVAGLGLLALKNWARWLTIFLAIPSLFLVPIGTVIGGLIIGYLLMSQAKEAFETPF